MTPARRLAGVAVLGVAALAATVAVRTLRAPSRQEPAEAPAPFTVRPGAAERLAAALRFRTVWNDDASLRDDGAFRELHAHLEASFPLAHGALERESVGAQGLMFRWAGADTTIKPVALLAHQDVVPADEAPGAGWAHPPFAGEIADGFVWGRGAIDDKGTLFAIFEALEGLLAEGLRPRRSIYFCLGHDEEVLGRDGAKRMAAMLGVRGVRLASVFDEGPPVALGLVPGVAVPVALPATAEKGYLTIELGVESPGGHSSMPSTPSPVGVLAAALTALERNPMPRALRGPPREMLEYVAPEMGGGLKVAATNLWLFAPAVEAFMAQSPPSNAALRTTTAVTMLEGSPKENVLPAHPKARVNFRLAPGDTVDTVVAHVRRAVGDERVRVTPRLDNYRPPSPVTSAEGPAFRTLARAARATLPGAVVAPSLMLGGTDSAAFLPIADEVLRFTPLPMNAADLERLHGLNERVGVRDYEIAIRFYAELLRRLASG